MTIVRVGAVALAIAQLLTGCVGLTVTLIFEKDGSGRVDMEISISKSALALAPESFPRPLPTSAAEVYEAFESIPEVVVEYARETVTQRNRVISAALRFDDFSALAGSPLFPGTGSTLRKLLGLRTLRVNVGPQGTVGTSGDPALSDCGCGATGNPASLNEEFDEGLAEELLLGYEIVYVVVAPKAIRSTSKGELSNDRRRVTLRLDTADYYYSEIPPVMTIKW